MIKTVSLETAKLLKEAGFRQDTYFSWEENPRPLKDRTESELSSILFVNKSPGLGEIYSAPTTDELLEELPTAHITLGNLMIKKVMRHKTVRFYVRYGNEDMSPHMENELLPEALAQMWLWLKKEGLI